MGITSSSKGDLYFAEGLIYATDLTVISKQLFGDKYTEEFWEAFLQALNDCCKIEKLEELFEAGVIAAIKRVDNELRKFEDDGEFFEFCQTDLCMGDFYEEEQTCENFMKLIAECSITLAFKYNGHYYQMWI